MNTYFPRMIEEIKDEILKIIWLPLFYLILLGSLIFASPAVAGEYCTPKNAGMEQPLASEALPTPLNSWFSGSIKSHHQNSVPSWSTTASDGAIEIWNNLHLSEYRPDLGAHSGNQYMELNANEAAANYVEIHTIPETILKWSIAHRGRDGVDSASISIGTPTDLSLQQTMVTDNTSWEVYSGEYLIPAGQTLTRFQINSISHAGESDGLGNFIDSLVFDCTPAKVPTLSQWSIFILILLLILSSLLFQNEHKRKRITTRK